MQRAFINPMRRTLAVSMTAGRTPVVMAAMRPVTGCRFNSSSTKDEKPADQADESKAAEQKPAEEESPLDPKDKEIADLKAKLDKKDKDLAVMKNHYARSVADFRSLQESTKKDMQKAKDFALQKFAKDLLESVDNFGRALDSVNKDTLGANPDLKQFYDGVDMTKNVFEKTLEKYGIEKINPEGQPFDPNQHEATFEIPQPDKEPGTVFHVQQVGYTLNSRVLRPAKVGVVKGEDN